jgi:hypothetical protein
MSDSFILSINNANSVVTSNNKFVYQFKIPFCADTSYEICLASGYLYNSLFNVNTSVFNNASYSIIMPTASGNVTLAIAMSNGFYDVNSGLNSYLQSICIQHGYYLIDQNGNNVFYVQLNTNIVFYAVTFTSTPIPTTLPTGWSFPTGGWGGSASNLPATTSTPQLVVSSNNFGTLIGYAAGTYPASMQTTLYNTNGTLTPELSPQYVFNLNINMINTTMYSSNPNSIYQFTFNTAFGNQQVLSPYQYQWFNLAQNCYNTVVVTLTDQINNPLLLNDSNSQVSFLIRRKTAAQK